MAPSAASRALVVVILLGLATFGALGTFGAGFSNGLFETLEKGPQSGIFPAGPKPYRTSYTGVEGLDKHLAGMIGFFTIIIDGKQTWDITLCYWYQMAQLSAGYCLLVLEGMRRGNGWRAVSFTGIMGIVFQNVTYTVTVPLYCILYLFTSPIAQPTADPVSLLAVDQGDLTLLPISNIICFGFPAVMMSLPSPSMVAPLAHYAWDAIWQIFPVVQNVFQSIIKQLFPSSSTTSSKTYRQAASIPYNYILALCVISQLSFFAVALTPASAVPLLWQPLFTDVTVSTAFVPYLPWSTPTVTPASVLVTGDGCADLAKTFFQWDLYCGGAAILVWALYLHSVSRPNKGLLSMLPKVIFWVLVGGPHAAATIVLWERDEVMLEAKAGKKE